MVGHYNADTGWVTRRVVLGDGRVEEAVADIEDVVDKLNESDKPISAAKWNDWFVTKGQPAHTANPTAPSYEAQADDDEPEYDGDDQADKATRVRPSESGVVHDAIGNVIGHFDYSTGWVSRWISLGSSHRPEQVAVPIDDVVKRNNKANGPASETEWNDWFQRNGVAAASPLAPALEYEPQASSHEFDQGIPPGKLTSISGFGMDGKPRALQASMAGPLVMKLIWEICSGLARKYGEENLLGLTFNAAGKLCVRVWKKGKEVRVPLSKRVENHLRKQINDKASGGNQQARRLKTALEKALFPYAAKLGKAISKSYRSTFFKAFPKLKGKVIVHHAVPQTVLNKYPGVISEAELHSLENLRGIPKGINSKLHLSKIAKEWNRFFDTYRTATKEQLLQKATEIDKLFGRQFKPPVGG